jgi:thiol-disulfide isomerase/thioredoxin
MSAAKTKAQGIIDDNKVVVFSKSYCPYCKSTKSLLSSLDASYYVLELDQIGTSLSLFLSLSSLGVGECVLILGGGR